MPSSTASPSKDDLRSQFRTYRRTLSDTSYSARSTLICSRTLGLSAVTKAATVHVYWPQIEDGEVDTRPLIEALQGQNTDVVMPVVTSHDPEDPSMEHRRYEGPDAMSVNEWGIREPDGTERISSDALDVVIVPALGAGRNGHRVGHGSGYYDAFLQTVDVPRIALVYEECLVPHVPADPHDVPMTIIVTEDSVVRPSEASS